jgi:hypothetical protein
VWYLLLQSHSTKLPERKMPAINKIAKIVGKTAENMKTGSKAVKDIKTAGKAANAKLAALPGGAPKMSKKDVAATVRGATASVRKTTGLPGPGKVAGAAGTAAVVGGVGALAAANREKGAAKATSTVSKPSGKPTTMPKGYKEENDSYLKPGMKDEKEGGKGAGKPEKLRSEPTGGATAGKSKGYRAQKGDSLWSIAEKTAPKGTSVAAWWTQIKKLNMEGGKVKRLYSNTAVRLPKGASVRDAGYNDSGRYTERREIQ